MINLIDILNEYIFVFFVDVSRYPDFEKYSYIAVGSILLYVATWVFVIAPFKYLKRLCGFKGGLK